jgi:flagellar biosynthesis/type III secretory pathway protein FliH
MTLSDTKKFSPWQPDGVVPGAQDKGFLPLSWAGAAPAQQQPFQQWEPKALQSIDGLGDEFKDQTTESNDHKEDQDSLSDQETATAEPEPELFPLEILEETKQQAFKDGHRIGYAEAEEKFSKARETFVQLANAFEVSQRDANQFFDPLKKLSLHIAQQLVRGELSLSPKVIERLVSGAIADIKGHGDMRMLLSLNPGEMNLIQGYLTKTQPTIELRPEPTMQPGSLKLSFDSGAIEDLMENRLAAIADSVMNESVTDQEAISGELSNYPIEEPEELEGQYEQPLVTPEAANEKNLDNERIDLAGDSPIVEEDGENPEDLVNTDPVKPSESRDD